MVVLLLLHLLLLLHPPLAASKWQPHQAPARAAGKEGTPRHEPQQDKTQHFIMGQLPLPPPAAPSTGCSRRRRAPPAPPSAPRQPQTPAARPPSQGTRRLRSSPPLSQSPGLGTRRRPRVPTRIPGRQRGACKGEGGAKRAGASPVNRVNARRLWKGRSISGRATESRPAFCECVHAAECRPSCRTPAGQRAAEP